MPAAAESPQLVRERVASLAAASIILLALPALALLVIECGPYTERVERAAWFAGCAVGAAALPWLYWAPNRAPGLVPYAAVAWVAAAAHGVYWHEWPGWAHGLPAGLAVGSLARGRRGPQPRWELAAHLGPAVVGVGLAWVLRERGWPFEGAEWLVLAAAVALAGWSAVKLFRPFFELSLEPVLWLMYRVRWSGPGFEDFPATGPCLVIANHACWLDPIFLAKVLPRPITPMMTSKFYDLPVMRRLMVLFGIIRVPDLALKKDAPEIQEAVAALDRGECVVIFPEGYLRRTEDRPLRRFGRGVWQILRARPGTPVFAAWIEGGWGSYTSYAGGPPTRNKKPDFRRPVGVGMSAAVAVPPELLPDHLATRTYLMNLVGQARTRLGLEPLPPFALPEKAEDESDAEVRPGPGA
jgi:1-acyl-sn-glycerol-3-phosphate acyltransferase